MVDRFEGIAEVDIRKVDIIGGKSWVFEGGGDHLNLTGCITLWVKVFLVKM